MQFLSNFDVKIMKKLRLKHQIALLVFVLVLGLSSIAAIGGFGLSKTYQQVERFSNVVSLANTQAMILRGNLLNSIRMEKNTILAQTDADVKKFTEKAIYYTSELDKSALELKPLLAKVGDPLLIEELSHFNEAWTVVKSNQSNILQLIANSTNKKAKNLINKDLQSKIDVFEMDLQSLSASDSINTSIHRKRGMSVDGAQSNQIDVLKKNTDYILQKIMIVLFRHVGESDIAIMNDYSSKINGYLNELDLNVEQLMGLVKPDQGANKILEDSRAIKSLVNQTIDLSLKNTNVEAMRLTTTITPEYGTKADNDIIKIIDTLHKEVETSSSQIKDVYDHALTSIFIASIIAFVVGVFVAQRISGSVNKGVTDVLKLSSSLSESAVAVNKISNELSDQSEKTSLQAGEVSSMTDHISSNVNTMAAAAEQMSMNVASISSASEEISVNVGQISTAAGQTSKNVELVVQNIATTVTALESVADDARDGAKISSEAADLAQSATTSMSALDLSAREVNKVTEIIKMIAMQTNLLALNAMIESTSAGEAGKGFAVVANEIKQLANQSAKAAEEIAKMVEGIQNDTRVAVDVIGTVNETITRINASSIRIFEAVGLEVSNAVTSTESLRSASASVSEIARAIHEIAIGTTDMARNSSEVAKAATDVSKSSSGTAVATQGISSNIRVVTDAAHLTNQSAEELTNASATLQQISIELTESLSELV
jgi:methyl-accepting chemotaxis protein